MQYSKFHSWKHAQVRSVGRGASYIRLTPFFGVKLCLFGYTLGYATQGGWFCHRSK